ncbi:MAG: L-rhamnonate dehydratase, partial [Firmicutes bacterium]|nr:L-rhamnonate dehydratase [Bacillota bacterium]
AVREALTFYATGPRPDLAQQMGFIGGKLPLPFGPASGEQGPQQNVKRFQTMRQRVGDDFWLMYDCWMALDVPCAIELANALAPYRPKWIEECFPPDDVWAYQALRQAVEGQMLVSTGEHEATRWGFRWLLESGAADFMQPDVTWCGGLTELLKISALADAHGAWDIPHGFSVYSYHFIMSRPNSPFAEFLMMHPDASQVVSMFFPLLEGEPVPIHGTLTLPDRPGFGVELNCALLRRANRDQEVSRDV